MLDFLGGIVSSIFGGGVTGILGVAIQRIADYKSKQLDLQINAQKMAHEIALRKVDAEIMGQEWAARAKVAEIEAAGKEAVADAEAFGKAFNEPTRYSIEVKPNAGQGWLLVILDFLRGIVRPGLTIYLCILTTMIYVQTRKLIGPDASNLNAEQAVVLVRAIIDTILYLTVTCVLYWFGTRQKQQPPKL